VAQVLLTGLQYIVYVPSTPLLQELRAAPMRPQPGRVGGARACPVRTGSIPGKSKGGGFSGALSA